MKGHLVVFLKGMCVKERKRDRKKESLPLSTVMPYKDLWVSHFRYEIRVGPIHVAALEG